MYVGLKMLTDVTTVTPETLLADAHDLMEKNRLWMLPVVEGGKLIGYLQKEDVCAALPSPATMLSKHELTTVMSKITVRDFIKTDIITVTPKTEIETAAQLMAANDLPGLAVVDSSHMLVGYINRSIMLDILIEGMGLDRGGSRFAIEFKDRPGVMAEVATLISDMGINFVSAASFYRKDKCLLVFRIQTDDIDPVVKALKERDYNVVGPENFTKRWS